ncbi:amylo-alpha-1,6-glucosidase [Massilia sp. TS11]|uniref:amylo-alpha-1,6-glucosidase n=1 Tax=Massilia sp. TS11 TaxID=2908003 RepID=UPI001EDC3A7B|nr:amylo-alpha-1,6-glucosidase [Massilia sp. TS11]MCG2583720.1 hypothetical protein [Massilia sp. TS11]
MKRTAAALALALILPAEAAQLPAIDTLFKEMAIHVKPGQQAQFVAGDNVAGYFEGYTQSEDKGAGYVLRSGTWFRNYRAYAGGRALARAGADEAVLPWGHQVRYADGTQTDLALLSGRQALALRVRSLRPMALALEPRLDLPAGAKLEALDARSWVVRLAPEQWLAIATDQAAQRDDAGRFSTRGAASSLTVVLQFGASRAEALAGARRLAGRQPIEAERRLHYQRLTRAWLRTSDPAYNKALLWARAAAQLFVVEEFGKGIWAGLPWFRDNWGRDTFIALPGTLLVNGRFGDARAVLDNFARYQNLKDGPEYGRIPNRVASGDSIIYNTVDGTPWMLREGLEYLRYSGDRAYAADLLRLAYPYFDGAFRHYVDSDGLLTHDGADTWMDARIEGRQPWSDRGPRAVEIQALWYTALQTGVTLARLAGDSDSAARWSQAADKARTRFLALFWDGQRMADRLRADASPDTHLRPNQLMLSTIPFDDFVPPAVQARVLKNAVTGLLYPYGLASLSQDDPYFHPRHENPDFHHKDAAYHQGTVWGWNAGFAVSALNKFGQQDLAWRLTRNLGEQILGLGTLGNMSELLDALPHEGGKLKPSGTFAQSWSVAEYARNGFQDYVGFRPDLLTNTLHFVPAVPRDWRFFEAVLPYAKEALDVHYTRSANGERWTLLQRGGQPHRLRFDLLGPDQSRQRVEFDSRPNASMVLEVGAHGATLDGRALTAQPVQASYAATIGKLDFLTPRPYRPQDFPMLRGRDVLKGIVEQNAYH